MSAVLGGGEIEHGLSVLALSLTIMLSVGALIIRYRDQGVITALIRTKGEETAALVGRLADRLTVDEGALSALRLEIAQRYVSNEQFQRAEERLLSAMAEVTLAIRTLTIRIDRAMDSRTANAD